MENKNRLIDANACPALFDEEYKATRKLINQGETHLDNLAEGFTEAYRVIQGMPTVDAVEVVRCVDCKHYGSISGVCYVDRKLGQTIPPIRVKHSDFCSYGERKDGE